MTTRLVTLITVLTAIVSCIAAIVVVPEVRCALNLTTGGMECARKGNVLLPDDETSRIQRLYANVEAARSHNRYDSIRKAIIGLPGDSAYATIYRSGDEIPLIRARIFSGNDRTSLLAYYNGGALAFIYEVSSHLPAAMDPEEFSQQRYYFADDTLIRWIGGLEKREMPRGSRRFDDAGKRMGALGARLMHGARASDPVIEF